LTPMERDMKLKQKVALVTGAGQGMGRAIAQRFAAEGATVVALDLNLEAAQQTLQGLEWPTPGTCSERGRLSRSQHRGR